MHRRLREATSACHRHLEEQLNLLGPELTLDRYSRVLRAFYGYYEPFEPLVFGAVAVSPPLGFALLPRAPLLARDLHALGIASGELANLSRCVDLPHVAVPAAAGCLYVLEGASLGGQVISRELERRLGITPPNGGSFFVGVGPLTLSRWKAVLAWIEELGADAHGGRIWVTPAATGGARFTFAIPCFA